MVGVILMTNDRRFFKPWYDDRADYNTNAKSYYDDLARKHKLIQLLAERIWEYDKELAKRFEQWDKNLEELDDEVIKMMVKWLENGILDDILNEEIMNNKPEIVLSKNEPQTTFSNTYWYHDVGLQTSI